MNVKRDEELERRLRDAAPNRFAAGFADRVAARLAEAPEFARGAAIDFTATLERQFLRVVPLLAAASLILAAYSWWGGRQSSDSLIDATLRLPQVSIATAYQSEFIYPDSGGDN
ncbi:MAG TPA: hypothetical protein VGM82_22835 [Gemmatimonadaceae bacterium]|jgi:hypothetical protein